jgi:hypothetical protein
MLVGWYRRWMRHSVISLKVSGSVPYEIISFFNFSNISRRNTALGSIQSLAEISARILPGIIG